MNSAHQAKRRCNFDSGWLERQQGGLHSFFWILSTQEICLVLEKNWKKVHSRTTTKLIPLLQSEHEFCQQKGPERGKVQDWYPNEKMVVVPVCLNCRSFWRLWVFSKFSKRSCQCNFSGIFKEGQIFLERCRNAKYLIRRLLWWHKALPGTI